MKQKIIPFILLLFTLNGFAQVLTINGYVQEQFDVYFDFNVAKISTSEKKKILNRFDKSANIEVSKIYGYCDWVGSNRYNDTLSIRRVKEVYNFLIENNIVVYDNYEAIGFGEDFKQSKTQSKNRKVTIFYNKESDTNKESNIESTEEPILVEAVSAVVKTREEIQNETFTEKINDAKVGDVVTLKNIYFKNRSSKIVQESQDSLYELLCVMQNNPNLKIQIQGHICCQLVTDFEDISTLRAKAIFIYLVQNKIKRTRILYKGFGITRPIHPIPEKNPQEEEENRRVEILVLEN